jgi:hypothetical protein
MATALMEKEEMIIKVKILRPLAGVFAECQPEVGKVYVASYRPSLKHTTYNLHYAPVCIIDVNGKKICLRPNEYEICEE